MFYLSLLAVLALVVGAIFLAPVRGKMWVAFTFVAIAAIAVVAPSIGVLMGAGSVMLIKEIPSMLGMGSLSIDALSAIFLLIIAIAGVATMLYSRGYLAH